MPARHEDRPACERMALPGGRVLGYSRLGAEDGTPVIYCHGFPASRLEAWLLHGAALEAGVSLIAPDRPGIGCSDFQPDRSIRDWPRDVARLADGLRLDRFRIVGGSGGCPYALACAHALPDRILRAGIIAGLGPAHDPGAVAAMPGPARLAFRLSRRRPTLFRLSYGALAQVVARFPGLLFRLNKPTPPDAAVLAIPDVRTILDASAGEAFRPGVAGALHELGLLARPWGFRPEEIAVPVDLWHGRTDGVVPFAMGEALAGRLPRAQFHAFPDEGHVSLVVRHAGEILRALVAT